jgi:CTP:molybdopterin cytidylyltransferase MocA
MVSRGSSSSRPIRRNRAGKEPLFIHKVCFERARIVEAPDFHEGCSASIRAGLEEVSPNAEAAVLILGDQPGIQSEALAAVIEGWRKIQSPVVRISYRGQSGHPVLLSRTIFAEIRELHGDKGSTGLFLSVGSRWSPDCDALNCGDLKYAFPYAMLPDSLS